MKGEKKIKVNGVEYTLTVRRNLVYTIVEICPEILKIQFDKNKKFSDDEQIEIGIKFSKGINDLFYEMIKIKHPDITKEQSDNILDCIYDEYGDFDESLIKFISESFNQGTPEKKKLNW